MIDGPKVLRPFNKHEAIPLTVAAEIADVSESTIRSWCARYHIGRRVVGGPWQVSKAALAMLLDGDQEALNAYLEGDRASAVVEPYFAGIKRDAA